MVAGVFVKRQVAEAIEKGVDLIIAKLRRFSSHQDCASAKSDLHRPHQVTS